MPLENNKYSEPTVTEKAVTHKTLTCPLGSELRYFNFGNMGTITLTPGWGTQYYQEPDPDPKSAVCVNPNREGSE